MELIAVAFVVSAAYVYAPVLRVHAARRLRLQLPAAEGQAAIAQLGSAESAPAQGLPPAIEKLCERESEEWAREQQRELARTLYADHGDWNVVAQYLDA